MTRPSAAPATLAARALLVLAWLAAIGAGYEWGGPAARAIRELKAGNLKGAVAAFEEARRERPTSSAVRYDQALGFAAAGSADSARAAYRDARSLEGAEGRAAAAFNEGNAAFRAGRNEEAIEAYRAALRDEPKRADAKRNLEEALRRARLASPQSLGGSTGTQGEGQGGTGQRQGGATPPPPGAAGGPKQSRQPSSGKDRQALGAPAPNRQEAEHWLDALEAERRAGRTREQAAKRASDQTGRSDHDW